MNVTPDMPTSNHPRVILVQHHPKVGKDERGIRGEPQGLHDSMPTRTGYADLDTMVGSLAMYTLNLWRMDPMKSHNRPTVVIATPDHTKHITGMADLLLRRMSVIPDVNAQLQRYGELDPIRAPLMERPQSELHPGAQYRVSKFRDELREWERGVLPAMPDPATVGSDMSLIDYVRRAAEGQRRLAASTTAAHTVLVMLTTTGGHLANAVLGSNAEEAQSKGVFPPTPTPYGYMHAYWLDTLSHVPVRLTSDPVRPSDIPLPPSPLNFDLDQEAARLTN